jgi:hypothetical protein
MPKEVLTDAYIALGGVDLSGLTNSIDWTGEFDELDATTFDDAGHRNYEAGLMKSAVKLDGFYDPAISEKVRDGLGAKKDLIIATHRTAGSRAYIAHGLQGKFDVSASIGQLMKGSATLTGSDRHGITSGKLLRATSAAAVTATGNSGTGQQLAGGIGATKELVAGLQILAVTGTPTFTAKVQSSTVEAMTSPTDRITFSAVTTGPGSQVKSATGPITDTWFRLAWTVSGSGSITFVAAVGRA